MAPFVDFIHFGFMFSVDVKEGLIRIKFVGFNMITHGIPKVVNDICKQKNKSCYKAAQ